jgi:hypothetical protein
MIHDPAKVPIAELREIAYQAVIDRIGVVGYVRLMQSQREGVGDAVADREKLIPATETIGELMEIIAREGARSPYGSDRPV